MKSKFRSIEFRGRQISHIMHVAPSDQPRPKLIYISAGCIGNYYGGGGGAERELSFSGCNMEQLDITTIYKAGYMSVLQDVILTNFYQFESTLQISFLSCVFRQSGK